MTGLLSRFFRLPSFDTVWPFFFLTLVLYLLFWRAGWSTALLAACYSLAQAGFLLAWLPWLGRWRRVSRADALFWGGVALFLLLPGAYLEYPADPWEHVRRILAWQSYATLGENPLASKQAYFFNWSFLRFFPLEARPFGLDILSGFWQLLLAVQVYRLARAFGFERPLAKLQVVGFICLFGTNCFGLRYYALSSTPLSYFAFLEVLILVQRGERAWKLLAALPCLLLLMYWNHHFQEISFTVICLGTIFAYRIFLLLPYRARVGVALVLLGVFFYSLWWGHELMKNPPEFYRQKGLVHYFSSLGTFLYWKRHLPYLQTLAVPGVITLAGALIFLRRYGELAVLTLAPFALLSVPFLVYLVCYLIPDPYATYRLLYAFPTHWLFVRLLWDATARFSRSVGARATVTGVLIVAFGAAWSFPWRGRLPLQVYRVPPEVDSRARLPLVAAFEPFRAELRGCRLYGDNPSVHLVATHLGLADYPPRLVTGKLSDAIGPLDAFTARRDVFGVLIADRSRLEPFLSEVGQVSDHWAPSLGSRLWYLDERVDTIERELKRRGWEIVPLPEPYRLYLNPQRECVPASSSR